MVRLSAGQVAEQAQATLLLIYIQFTSRCLQILTIGLEMSKLVDGSRLTTDKHTAHPIP